MKTLIFLTLLTIFFLINAYENNILKLKIYIYEQLVKFSCLVNSHRLIHANLTYLWLNERFQLSGSRKLKTQKMLERLLKEYRKELKIIQVKMYTRFFLNMQLKVGMKYYMLLTTVFLEKGIEKRLENVKMLRQF